MPSDRFSHGGTLRNSRKGRKARPLSSREPLHLVFKANKSRIKSGLRSYKRFFLIQSLLQKYAVKFFVRLEQVSVQNDHIHLLIRTSKRSNFQSFFRVIAGQIAQQFEKEGLLTVASVTNTSTAVSASDDEASKPTTQPKLWMYRPFTRVVRGWKAYKTMREYTQLNEQEALGNIPYKKKRLRGLKLEEWEILWSSPRKPKPSPP